MLSDILLPCPKMTPFTYVGWTVGMKKNDLI